MENATVFSEDPGAIASHWLSQGARRLHLVDLNGAFAGKPKNEPAIRDIVEAIGDEIPTQLGGGIRDLETIERYLDDGITYIIIGTAAVKTPGFLHDAANASPATHGRAGCEGWKGGCEGCLKGPVTSRGSRQEVQDYESKRFLYDIDARHVAAIGRPAELARRGTIPVLPLVHAI